MGLAISPQVWITYIENLLEGVPSKQSYIAIMDDLLLHGLKSDHMLLLENLLIALVAHGLKLSPRKCQLFMRHLVYLGNVFHIKDGRITITPMKSKIEAIQKLQAPSTAKACKSFCGVVNYLSLFCKDLQKILKPIYELTRKEMPFHWPELHQKAFLEVKELLVKPPILHLPRSIGRFILYCDTSKTHTGSSLWQVQHGKPRLLGYASKSLPEACKNYSVTELEMTGLAVNIHLWKHLLLRVEFDCAVDHRALPYIMKSKNLPATGRIIRLLELLSGYCFNLYYVKGKDMILCDYLSRIAVDEGDPSEVIPISFNALAQYRLAIDYLTEAYMITHFNVATRSSTDAAGINLPPIHGANKGIDPTLKPENQSKSQQTLAQPQLTVPNQRPIKPVVRWTPSKTPTRPITKSPNLSAKSSPVNIQKTPVHVQTPVITRSIMSKQNIPNSTSKQTPVRGQQMIKTPISSAQQASRKLIQRSVKLLNTPRSTTDTSLPSPVKLFPSTQYDHVNTRSSEDTLTDRNLTANRALSTDKHVDETTLAPNFRQPLANIPKLPPQQTLMPQENPFDIQSDLIPHQEKEIEPIFKTPVLDDFLLPPVLGDQITDTTLMHRYLPRQSDIDRIMEQIKRKYLTKLQLPCSLRDMQAAYLNSPHFRDIYLAVGMNRLPNTTRSAKKLENDLRNAVYMIHGGLLYKYIQTNTGDSEPVLCIPVSKIDIFLELFHSSILSGHMGMSKCVLTLQQKIYYPNLAYHVRMYIIS